RNWWSRWPPAWERELSHLRTTQPPGKTLRPTSVNLHFGRGAPAQFEPPAKPAKPQSQFGDNSLRTPKLSLTAVSKPPGLGRSRPCVFHTGNCSCAGCFSDTP